MEKTMNKQTNKAIERNTKLHIAIQKALAELSTVNAPSIERAKRYLVNAILNK